MYKIFLPKIKKQTNKYINIKSNSEFFFFCEREREDPTCMSITSRAVCFHLSAMFQNPKTQQKGSNFFLSKAKQNLEGESGR